MGYEGHKKYLVWDEYVHSLHCGHGFTSVHVLKRIKLYTNYG